MPIRYSLRVLLGIIALLAAVAGWAGMRVRERECAKIAIASRGGSIIYVRGSWCDRIWGPRVRAVVLSGAECDSSAIQSILPFDEVEAISMVGGNVHDVDIASLARLPCLTTLDLSHTSISDTCIPQLASIRSLKLLHIGGTRISGTGLVELCKTSSVVEVDIGVRGRGQQAMADDSIMRAKACRPGLTVTWTELE